MTTSTSDAPQGDAGSFPREKIQSALDRVLASKDFRGSARMQSFLTYVVTEALAGRTDEIRAKTIAMDVYGYSADDLSRREGVVRVDAGRVRRKLKAYYGGEGATDPVVISLPVGSYAPEFQLGAGSPAGQRNLLLIGVVTGAVLLGVGGYLAAIFFGESSPVSPTGDQSTIYDVSPTRVEAMNLCNAGRDLIFPVVDLPRLRPALLVFETATQRDPLYYCGYAGAAQVETMLAILQFWDPVAEELLEAANQNSSHALELAPDAPWALSARAWFEFATGNFDKAVNLTHRATDMGPDDPHIAEFDALISLYTSDFERVLSQANHYQTMAEDGGGSVAGNALGAAQFHTGDYAGAIRTYEDTIARGGPFGPISTAYLMAAHWKNGDQVEARRLAEVYVRTWPNFPLEELKIRTFSDPAPVQDLTSAMRAAGWGSAEPTTAK
ncbi:Tetratricopeptide repeat [Ruegeria denitrificans]|uniref:Tetratricopeptide repeat n=1 Tax=Ruegeria denitrificans TaxID=1715692 RepID=A0A0N7MAA3_9RHOB|nr:tetratricopeptide repeat protein [Ruegeria denitrificans]CUK09198.1 Tetratricopeptide repeat [Ruegeria denitrificans]